MIQTVKGFGIINRSRCFSGTLLLFWWINRCCQFDLWFLCLLKSSLNIWMFTVHILLKPGLENFEHYFASMWDKCSHTVAWVFFGTAFLWNWNENWLLQSCGHWNLLAYWVQRSVFRQRHCLIVCLLACKVCVRRLRHRRAHRSPGLAPRSLTSCLWACLLALTDADNMVTLFLWWLNSSPL